MTRQAQVQAGSTINPYEVEFIDFSGNVVDISAATIKQILMFPETGPDLVLTATFTNTGTDGKIQAIVSAAQTAAGGAGKWEVQGKVVYADGTVLFTKPGYLEVLANAS